MGMQWVGRVGVVAATVLSGWSCSGSSGDTGSGGATADGEPSGGATADGFGGDSEDGGGGTNSTGGASATGGAFSSGGTLSSGGSSGGNQGAATGGENGMGGAVPADPPELYPMALGNSWTTNAPDVQAGCDPAYPGQEIHATDEVGGREAWVLSHFCYPSDLANDTRITVIDGEVAQWLDSEWQVILAEPVEVGHTWTVQIATTIIEFRWVYAGEVTVPAGTFPGCWRREQTTEVGYGLTYCPGIGPVRWASESGVIELAAYDLQ